MDIRKNRVVKIVKIEKTRYELEGFYVVRWFEFESGLKFRNQDEESDRYRNAYNGTVKKHLANSEEFENWRISDQTALHALSSESSIEEFPVRLSSQLILDVRGDSVSLSNGKGDELLVFVADTIPQDPKIIRPDVVNAFVVQLGNSFFFVSIDGRLLLQMTAKGRRKN